MTVILRNEETIPHPYTYMPARVGYDDTGARRWFDVDTGTELPPFYGYGNDVQEKVDAWYRTKNENINE